jgi:transposase
VIQERNTVQSHKRRGTGHEEKVRFLGLDVHAETIAVAIAEPDGEVRSLGTIANRAESIRKLVKKLGPVEQLKACYEAGPTGYVLYWQLAELGVACEVIAPTLVPMKAGDRVKTDRRDAERLARSFRSGDLTAVWVPDEESEALRDLVRAREAAKQDQLRARHRLSKFLLRTGQRPAVGREGVDAESTWPGCGSCRFTQVAQESTRLDYLHEVEHMAERVVRLEQAITEAVKLASPADAGSGQGLQALRGVAQISAVTIVSRVGRRSRVLISARQADGLQRRGAQRELQRRTNAARQHHQDRQRASATSRGRGGLELSTATWRRDRRCANDKKACRKRSRRSPGRRRSPAYTNATPDWRRRARIRGRSSPPWGANCWASSGPSGSRRKRQPNRRWRPDGRGQSQALRVSSGKGKQEQQQQQKLFQRMKKQRQKHR